ncbi:MAG TPA: hypothetical protein VGG03_24555 [Thermoanaerobaculia bacterium]|jgi:hypothetical protein
MAFSLTPLVLCLTAWALSGATQPADPAAAGWEPYAEEGGCIGGSRCGDQGDAIRIPLEDAPVQGVRFRAHDDVGETSDGRLRVRIDAAAVASDLDVAKGGDLYELPVNGLRGRFLIIETRTDDEVVVEDIEVRYNGLRRPRQRREWRAYPEEAGCIGGERCRDQGRAIRIPLEDARVYGVRFHAHDNVGPRTRGHLRVRIDSRSIAQDIDVPRAGESYNLLLSGLRGRFLVFEALTSEEVVVEDIEVQYAGLRDPWERRRR